MKALIGILSQLQGLQITNNHSPTTNDKLLLAADQVAKTKQRIDYWLLAIGYLSLKPANFKAPNSHSPMTNNQ